MLLHQEPSFPERISGSGPER